jgi:hypothetical protein
MLLLNPTDDRLQHTAGVRAPSNHGAQDITYPPRLFIFEPGAQMEVPDDVGAVLLDHLGPRGLVRFQIGDDLDAVRREGRRAWYNWCFAQVKRHRKLNNGQRQRGLESIDPNPDVLKAYRTWRKLKDTEFRDEIMDDPSIPEVTEEEMIDLGGLDGETARVFQRRARLSRLDGDLADAR